MQENNNLWLIIVGSDEGGMATELNHPLGGSGRCWIFPHTAAIKQFMVCSVIICLLTIREAFGIVIIESAAIGIPCAASRITGITDAVQDEVTGLLFESGNTKDFCSKLSRLIENQELRSRLGALAKKE